MANLFDEILDEEANVESLFDEDDTGFQLPDESDVDQQLSKKERKRLENERKKLEKQMKKEAKCNKKKNKRNDYTEQEMYVDTNDFAEDYDNFGVEDCVDDYTSNTSQGEPYPDLQTQNQYQQPQQTQQAYDDFYGEQPVDYEEPKQKKKSRNKEKNKKPQKHTSIHITSRSKSNSPKYTDPRFRKEDIHAQTTPYLDVDVLMLNGNSSNLYIDELKRLEEREMYVPQSVEPEMDNTYFEPVISSFDAEDFLSNIPPVIEPLDIQEQEETIVEIQEPELDFAELELPELIPEPVTENIPILEIKELDINLDEGTLDFGSSTAVKKEQTSITFNKESLAHIAERIR